MSEEVGITKEFRPSSGEPAYRSQVILNLAKKHDGWKLQCYSQNADDEGFPTAVNRSIVVQFQMRPDDTCPATFPLSLTTRTRDSSAQLRSIRGVPLKYGYRIPLQSCCLSSERTDALLDSTVIYYKRSLHSCPIDICDFITIETTDCKMIRHDTTVIVSIYLSPSKTWLRSDLETLFALGGAVTFFGDVNCKHADWRCLACNANGVKLERLQKKNLSSKSLHSSHRHTSPMS
ncbi:hypothetical protein EVAR_34728_1 [Eumeta japonica]|uniref:RNA-directed DNA polymerase from mobile element jockey n=1 Tax=Eumeta variegata TaxID=151549 RepID=A0A4C1XC67_EUMVA|nr:hypothetical protein EVAR_34728_1 [Eumeta japonica]